MRIVNIASLFLTFLFVAQSSATGQFLDHSVGVYFSPKGLNQISTQLPTILETSGFNIHSITYDHTQFTLEDKKLEDYFVNKKNQEKIVSIKRFLNSFFDLTVESETYSVALEGLKIKPTWKKIGLHILPPDHTAFDEDRTSQQGDTITAQGYLQLISEDIKINIDKIVASDVENPQLGKIDISGVSINKVSRNNLWLNIPFVLGKKPSGLFYISVLPPTSSFDQIKLKYSYQSLELPQLELVVNGHKRQISLPQVQQFIDEQSAGINEKIREKAKSFTYEKLPQIINDKLSDITKNGLSEVNVMRPPGAPKNESATPFQWKLELTDVDFQGPYFHIGLGAYFEDPISQNNTHLPAPYHAKKLPDPNLFFWDTDVIFSLSQTVINRVIQLSFERGYFRYIGAGDDTIKLAKAPVMNFAARTDGLGVYHKPSTLTLMIEYDVEGFSAIAVKNPMRIQFDLNVKTFVENNQIKIVATDLEPSSIHVPEKDVYMFYKSVVRKVLQELQQKANAFANYELIGDLPIPGAIGGTPLIHINSKLQDTGHIIISSELSQGEVEQ